MRKKVIIAGIGLGNPETATLQVINAIKEAEVLIGAERMIAPFAREGKKLINEYRGSEIAGIIKSENAEKFVVLVSGDPGLYSGAQSIAESLSEFEPEIFPGVSSVSYFCSRLGQAWNDAEVVSAHGRSINIVSEVRRNKKTFVLTDGNISELLERLCEYGFGGLTVYVGERLSYPEEKITSGTAQEIRDMDFDPLSVMFIINDNADARIPAGIMDDAFERGDVPMTKQEVRAVTMAALQVTPESIVYDIGAGTGSVSIEAAFAAYRGTVYAIEYKPQAIELMKKNSRIMSVDNIVEVEGFAPEALEELPAPNLVFIGGSDGKLSDIIDALIEKNTAAGKDLRIVINAVSMETIAASVTMLSGKKALKIEYTQISSARNRNAGEYNLLQAQNPVFIIKADFVLSRKKAANEA